MGDWSRSLQSQLFTVGSACEAGTVMSNMSVQWCVSEQKISVMSVQTCQLQYAQHKLLCCGAGLRKAQHAAKQAPIRGDRHTKAKQRVILEPNPSEG